jgi:hypothetical protein
MAGSPLIADGLRPAEVGVNQAFLETAGNSRPPSDEELVSASQNHCVRVLAGASVGWGLRRRAYSERSLCGRNPLGARRTKPAPRKLRIIGGSCGSSTLCRSRPI